MRLVAALIMAAAIIYFVIRPPARETAAADNTARAAQSSPTPSPEAQTWPKRSLDRAATVKRQVAETRKVNELP